MSEAPLLRDLELIDALADQFEAAWKRRARPDLAAFIATVPDACRRPVLIELVGLDVEYRRRNGEAAALEEYLQRFPDLCDTREELSASLARRQAPGGMAASAAHGPTARDGMASGRYHVVEEIGRGGFAVVYKARDTRLNRLVAIKRLLADKTADSAVDRFVRESRAIAALNHRNIVQVFDSDQDADGYYIVMEYVDGGSLREHLKSRGRLPVEEALALVRGIAQGLSFAHRRNLVHRDIKPGNILISKEGDQLIPRIADFGLAQLGRDSSLSRTGYAMGTPLYMPPEQLRDAKSVNQTADIYALGKLLYELVTGNAPDAVHPKHIPPSARLASVILKCVEPRPEDRFFSAEELVRALAEVETEPVPGNASQPKPQSLASCPACETENDKDARFCISCGTGLRRNCPECAKETSVRIGYCPSCGTAIDVFLRLQQAASQMEQYRAEQKSSRVLKEAQLCAELRFVARGKNGRSLLARVDRLQAEAATAAAAQRKADQRRQQVERDLRAAMQAARDRRSWADAVLAANELLKLNPPDAEGVRSEISVFEAAAGEDRRCRQEADLLERLTTAEKKGQWSGACAAAEELLVRGASEPDKVARRRDRAARIQRLGEEVIGLLRAGRFADCDAVCGTLAAECGADLPLCVGDYQGSSSELAALARAGMKRQARCVELRRQLDEARRARAWHRGRSLSTELLGLSARDPAAVAFVAAYRLRLRIALELSLGLAALLIGLFAPGLYWQRQIRAFDAAVALRNDAEAERAARALNGRHPAAEMWLSGRAPRTGAQPLYRLPSWNETWRIKWQEALFQRTRQEKLLARWKPSSLVQAEAAADAAARADAANLGESAVHWRQACLCVQAAVRDALRAEARDLVRTLLTEDAERAARHACLMELVAEMGQWLPEPDETRQYVVAAEQLPRLLGLRDAYKADEAGSIAVLAAYPTPEWDRVKAASEVARKAAEDSRWGASAEAWQEASALLAGAREASARKCADSARKACDRAGLTGDWAQAHGQVLDALKLLPDSPILLSLETEARVRPAIRSARDGYERRERSAAALFDLLHKEYESGKANPDSPAEDPSHVWSDVVKLRDAAVAAQEKKEWEQTVRAWNSAAAAAEAAQRAGETLKSEWVAGILKTAECDAQWWEHRDRAVKQVGRALRLDGGNQKALSLAEMIAGVESPEKEGGKFTNSIGMVLVYLPAGKYTRGSPEAEAGHQADEARTDAVISLPFFIAETEVTQAQWRDLMSTQLPLAPAAIASPSSHSGGDLPVNGIGKEAAELFCKRLNELEKQAHRFYRLPTEEEWEYACRAGSEGPWGMGADGKPGNLDEMAWYRNDKAIGVTHPVRLKKPNAWGLYDMHGNVQEWCAGAYPDYDKDPTGQTPSSDACVLRGGAFDRWAEGCRAASRYRGAKNSPPQKSYGFRVVMCPARPGRERASPQ